MKTRISLVIINLIILLFSQCKNHEYDMLTIINADGSSSRQFVQLVDSAFMIGKVMHNNPFPIIADSSWLLTWTCENELNRTDWPLKSWESNDNKAILRLSRHFKTPEEINDFDYLSYGNWQHIKTKTKLEKNTNLLFTYYLLEEVFPAINIDKIGINNFMTKEEIEIWFRGNDARFKGMNGVEIKEYLDDIDEKFEKWQQRNTYEMCFEIIWNNFFLFEIYGIDKKRFSAAKDTIYAIHEKQNMDALDEKLLDNYFNTTAFSEILNQNNQISLQADSALQFINIYGNSLNYKLLLPGKILESNATFNYGDTLAWKVDAFRFTQGDFVIKAQSRKLNILFIIASLSVIVLGVLFSFNHFKRK